jgi:hypothetical protein
MFALSPHRSRLDTLDTALTEMLSAEQREQASYVVVNPFINFNLLFCHGSFIEMGEPSHHHRDNHELNSREVSRHSRLFNTRRRRDAPCALQGAAAGLQY